MQGLESLMQSKNYFFDFSRKISLSVFSLLGAILSHSPCYMPWACHYS